jgi:hypothetical protein
MSDGRHRPASKGSFMPDLVQLEDIEEMRRREGIDDLELRMEIRALKAGDMVKVTMVAESKAFETVLVRITSIRGSTFRGKLVRRPTSAGLKRLAAGAAISFTTAHIHSLLKRMEDES